MTDFSFTASADRHIKIPIRGTPLIINGVLRGEWSQPLVILIHGLAGDNRGLLPFLLSKLLHEHGFATLRINMYDDTPYTRDMIDCTMDTHAQDLNTIVSFAQKQGSPQIFAVGHSYGGLTILSSSAVLDGAVLLEPSHFKCSMEYDHILRANRHEVTPNVIVYENGAGFIDPLPMAQERIRKADLPEETLAQKPYPLLFVAAENCMLLPYIRNYYHVASHPKKLYVANGASHALTDTDEIMLGVFRETLEWLKKHS